MLTRRCLTIQKRNFFFAKNLPEAEVNYHLVTENARTPVIMLIGWAGADQKHVEKYVRMYNEQGYTVASICPPRYHFKVPDASIGAKITPVFRKFDKRPIVLHSFSMNGIRGVISLWKASGKADFERKIEGIIFDSAPSHPTSGQNSKAMMLSRPSSSILSDSGIMTVFRWLLDIRNFLLSPILNYFPSIRPEFSLYWFIQDRITLPRK